MCHWSVFGEGWGEVQRQLWVGAKNDNGWEIGVSEQPWAVFLLVACLIERACASHCVCDRSICVHSFTSIHILSCFQCFVFSQKMLYCYMGNIIYLQVATGNLGIPVILRAVFNFETFFFLFFNLALVSLGLIKHLPVSVFKMDCS